MPAPYTLPPDTRSVGSGNPPADVNAHTDALIAMVPEKRQQLPVPERENETPLRGSEIIDRRGVYDAKSPRSGKQLKSAPAREQRSARIGGRRRVDSSSHRTLPA